MGASVDYLVADKSTGRLSFRRTIPIPLRPFIPGSRVEVKRSLATRSIGDPKGAMIFAAASEEYDRLVALARKTMAREFDALDTPMTAFLVER